MDHKHIIGITGSAGKSSAREAIYAVLKDKYKVKSGHKSLNTEIGLPTDVLGFDEFSWKVVIFAPFKILFDWKKYDVYIAEMGVDKPGDMDYLISIVLPDIGVFLNVLPVHTFNFPDGLSGISKEKGKLVMASKIDVLNADDPNVIKFKDSHSITFGKQGQIKPFVIKKDGFLFTEDYGYTFAAAAAVGEILGISFEQSKKNLEKNLVLPPGRMSVFEGINGSTIIDSTYNSSRVPAIAALKALKKYPGKRKIAVLGDMRELGDLAEEEHKLVIKEALLDADLIYSFGPLTEKYFPLNEKIKKFNKMGELIEEVKQQVKDGDVILVKGSQNTIFLERLVEALLKDREDEKRLARRGKFWEEKRNQTPKVL